MKRTFCNHFSEVNPDCTSQVCISGQMYKIAGKFLDDHDILEIDPRSSPIQSQDYLEFFYYGGIW